MKILFDGIIYSLQPVGGITRYATELINGLADNGQKVDVLLHTKTYPTKGNFVPGVSEHTISLLPTVFPSPTLKYLAHPLDRFLASRVAATFGDVNDVFHSTYFTTYSTLRIPQVITVHDFVFEKFPELQNARVKLFLRLKREAIKRANGIICVSNNTRADLESLYDVGGKKITTVYHGVSDLFRRTLSSIISSSIRAFLDLQQPYLLFVGNRDGYKNFSTFIKSFGQWQGSKKYVIALAGGGPLTQQEKNFIVQHVPMEKIFHFDGISDDEIATLYRHAQAFVFPSWYEGFGLPLIESFAAGTLVICADTKVFKEVGKSAPLYVNPHQTDSFVEAFDQIEKEKNNTQRRDAALARSLEFAWGKCVDETLAFYRTLI